MNTQIKKFFLFLSVLIVLFQFFPVEHSNPEIQAEIRIGEKIKSVLKRSCYDCHSNETLWPYYSYIFPFSILVSHHVSEGRGELNFSSWENLSPKKKSSRAKDIIEEIESGEMPPGYYILFNKKAVLSKDEIDLLKEWADKLVSE